MPTPSGLLKVGPHNNAHLVAIRAGVSLAIPLLVLWSVDRLDLSLYAAFGAFTSLYGRIHTHRPRARMQVSAAIWLVGMTAIGAAVGVSPARDWLVVGVVAITATLGSLVSDALRWHPTGPLFGVFALAACASVPGTAATVPVALGVSAASAALALLIGVLGYVRPRARRVQQTTVAVSFRRAFGRGEGWRVAAQYGVAVLVSGLIPTATGLGHPYWAMVAAVAALAASDARSRLIRAGHRIIGTVVGVGVAAGILALPLSALAVIAIAVLLQVGAELLVGRNYGIALICVTPLALLMVALARPDDPWILIRDRGLETVLGAVVGIVVTLVAHRRAQRRAQRRAAVDPG